MQFQDLTLVGHPALGVNLSEAEIFGSAVWVWMNSPKQASMPLSALPLWLLPALQTRQFVLAYETKDLEKSPVAYLAWAQLSADAERRYVQNPATGLSPKDWQSGDRYWITDFFAPRGHAKQFTQALRQAFPNFYGRALYHRGPERGMRVLHFRGNSISQAQAKQWWHDKPILA